MSKSKKKRPLILVVNDDGVDAKGIRVLADVAQEFGRVVMIAPGGGRSGMSHAITFSSPLRFRRLHYSDNFEIYRTNGTPVDAIKLALRHILKDEQVDLLVSGINQGANTSVSVFYSATVAAAVEGCLCGIPSVAFSQVDFTHNTDFELAKISVQKIIPSVLEKGLPPNICLNVNIPNIPLQDAKGIKITRQERNYWHEDFDMRTDPANNPYFWMSGCMQEIDNDRDTDIWAIKHNYISVHPLKTDWTDQEMIQKLKKWNIKL